MPAQLPVGPYKMVRTADNRTVPWYVIPFDEHGTCTGPRTRDDLVQRARTGGFTDIVVFCHGWNNDWRQATGRYDDFFNGFVRMRAERGLPVPDGFNPLLVGIFWPSKLLVAEADLGPDIAGDEVDDDLVADERQAVEDLARYLGPDRAPRFFELAQQDRLSEADARELAGILAPLYATDRDETADAQAPAPADIVDSWIAPRRRPAAADPADFGVAAPEPAAGDPLAAGFLDFLKPQEIIRSASVWLMKDRAGRVGARGVGPLLSALVGSGARVHVVGHSFGAKVMLSAIVAPPSLPGRVHSALLLEPAVSHLCFAADANGKGGPGGYRPALDRVTRPILTTFSAHDVPLTKVFHLALRRAGDLGEAQIAGDEPPNRYAALGGFGPRPLGADTELVSVLDPTAPYPLDAGATRVIGVNGTRTISAHGDVSNPSTWWMLYNLMTR